MLTGNFFFITQHGENATKFIAILDGLGMSQFLILISYHTYFIYKKELYCSFTTQSKEAYCLFCHCMLEVYVIFYNIGVHR